LSKRERDAALKDVTPEQMRLCLEDGLMFAWSLRFGAITQKTDG